MEKQCKHFKTCTATLCPLDQDTLKSKWFPDEAICVKFNYKWIKAQRKIFKICRDKSRYFTYSMLARDCVIGKRMMGLDPDKEQKVELSKWLKKHAAKKELSEDERTKFIKTMKKAKEETSYEM